MGCFFACFRIKDDERRKTHLVSNPIPSKSWDPVVSKNQLASVFLCEEKSSPYERAVDRSSQENIGKDGFDGELKHEAKFLKSIGILQETPPEIRKASEKIIVQTTNEDGLSFTSCKKLDWDEQLGQISDSPAQLHESSRLQENRFRGYKSEEHQTLRKATRFEGLTHESGVESELEPVNLDLSPSQSDCQIQAFASNHSPYPTPINLTDEMQTPGTVYPANLERTGKNARVRTQYLYPVLNPAMNLTQWKARSADSSDLFEQQMKDVSPDGRETIRQAQRMRRQDQETSSTSAVTPLCSRDQVKFNPDSPQLVVTSLSHWLKPPAPKDERGNYMDSTKERSHSEKGSDADRPIIGLVSAHWNDDEPSNISPKWWDGNGIPNSTNKYKEDQKVSWHATPFEVRLEKALSDEKLCPQRKNFEGKPIEFEDEGDESDTAAS